MKDKHKKASEIFEGEQSSLRKTFDSATKSRLPRELVEEAIRKSNADQRKIMGYER